jgi:hypothetical protein
VVHLSYHAFPILSVLSYHIRGSNLGSYLALRGNDSDGSYARMVYVGDVDLTPFLVHCNVYDCDKQGARSSVPCQATPESGHDSDLGLGTSETCRPNWLVVLYSYDSEALSVTVRDQWPPRQCYRGRFSMHESVSHTIFTSTPPDSLCHGFGLPYFFVFEFANQRTII